MLHAFVWVGLTYLTSMLAQIICAVTEEIKPVYYIFLGVNTVALVGTLVSLGWLVWELGAYTLANL